MRGEISQSPTEGAGIGFPKTHDLPYLLTLVLNPEPSWAVLQPQVDGLKDYAVEFRYPGKSATKTEARQAIADCREIRQVVRTVFGLPV
jgi:HEPN domain